MAGKNPVMETLDSFSEEDARAIAEALVRIESIKATVRRLMVGDRNDQPTEWWLVEVPTRSMLSANTWLRGWRSGRLHHRIERYREHDGGTYGEAAHRLGYLEVMPKADPTDLTEVPDHMRQRANMRRGT